MRLREKLSAMRGVVKLTAYEGDVEKVACDCSCPDWPKDLVCVRCNGTGEIIVNPVVYESVRDNLIVTAGKNLSMDRLYNALAVMNGLTHTGVGTSATAAAAADVSLTGGVWKVFDAAPTRSAQTVTSITSFTTAEANINIQEAALANAAAGTQVNRLAPIGPFNKTTAVSLSVTVAITQG